MGIRLAGCALVALLVAAAGCFGPSPSRGGGQVKASPARLADPHDILLPRGYRAEVVAKGLTFPTGVAFDDQDRPCVVESGYAYGEVWTTPRLLRVEPSRRTTQIATGPGAPWNGVAY